MAKIRVSAWILSLVATAAILFLAGRMLLHYYGVVFTPDDIAFFLTRLNATPYLFPRILLLYVVGGFFLFPVVVLNLACAMAFGPVWGILYGFCGSLLSAFVYFRAGRLLRRMPHIRRFFEGGRPRMIDQRLKDGGVTGVALIRLMPIAPFTVFNVTAGISSIGFIPFYAGTALALIPGVLVRGLLGASLMQFILHPDIKTAALLLAGLAFWLVVVYICNTLVKRWRQNADNGENAPPQLSPDEARRHV